MGARLSMLAAAACLATAALLAACASGERFTGPGGTERLYRARCSRCHVPYAPTDFLPSEWPGIVDEMGPRAGLDAPLRARVTQYLVTASAR